jgi:hypothetical protein
MFCCVRLFVQLRFELTRDQLGGVLDQFKDIEEALAAYK